MYLKTKSIRPFIGAKDYSLSRQFYREMGFQETILDDKMSVFRMGIASFYLQDYYAKDWIDNSMVFLEVANPQLFYEELHALDLSEKYPGVKLSPVRNLDWGSECFLHDPSGILWHIGNFKDSQGPGQS